MTKLLGNVLAMCGAVMASITGLGTSVASAQQEFRGRACIISANAYCANRGFKVGDCVDMRYTPPNALGNGNNTRLSFFYPNYSQNFRQMGSAIGLAYQDVNFSYIARGGGTADQSLTKWRIPLVQPSNYSLPYVHLVVDFFRYDDFDPTDRSLCSLRWRGTAQKWPDQAPAKGSAEARLPALDFAAGASPLGNTLPRIGN
jgi:hypothetical protein